MDRTTKVLLALFGGPIAALFFMLAVAAIRPEAPIRHALLWSAFGVLAICSPLASWRHWRSWKHSTATLALVIVVGGPSLLRFDTWISRQEAGNQLRGVNTVPAGPQARLQKTPKGWKSLNSQEQRNSGGTNLQQQQSNSGGQNIQQQNSGRGANNAVIGNGNSVGNTTYNINSAPLQTPTVGILGGDSSAIMNSQVSGFQEGIDLRNTKGAIVDHTTVTAPPKEQPPPQPQAQNDSHHTVNLGNFSHTICEQCIVEGTLSLRGSDHFALINSMVIPADDPFVQQRLREQMEVKVLDALRDHRQDAFGIADYLIRVHSAFQRAWKNSPPDIQVHNEILWQQFQSSTEDVPFDEERTRMLFKDVLAVTPVQIP